MSLQWLIPRYCNALQGADFGHSPEPWRVNVVLGNMPEFAKDFHCPAGARMRPADTCTVW